MKSHGFDTVLPQSPTKFEINTVPRPFMFVCCNFVWDWVEGPSLMIKNVFIERENISKSFDTTTLKSVKLYLSCFVFFISYLPFFLTVTCLSHSSKTKQTKPTCVTSGLATSRDIARAPTHWSRGVGHCPTRRQSPSAILPMMRVAPIVCSLLLRVTSGPLDVRSLRCTPAKTCGLRIGRREHLREASWGMTSSQMGSNNSKPRLAQS